MPPCSDGYGRAADGNCKPIDYGSTTEPVDDTPAVDTGEDPSPQDDTDTPPVDTGTPGTPGTVGRGECTESSDGSEPSLVRIGHLDTDEGMGPPPILIELLDSDLEDDRFWAVGQGGLMSFDISDSDPVLCNVYPGPMGRFHRLLLVEDSTPLVYVTHRDLGLSVVDRTNPGNLRTVDSLAMAGLGGMVIDGDQLYVTRHDGPLAVFDISDRQQPSLVTTIDAPGHPWNVVANGDTLYTADNTDGVGVFSRSTTEFEYSHHLDVGSGTLDLAHASGHLFVAAGSGGFVVMSTEDPSHPTEIARIKTGSPLVDVSVSNTTAWVVDHEAVWAIDISEPSSPVVIGRSETTRFAMTVTASGTDAWVGDWTAVAGYRAYPDRAQATVVAYPDTIRIPPGTDQTTVQLTNFGPSAGDVLAWDANDDSVEATIPDADIETGEATTIELQWPDDADNGRFCVRTNDPNAPEIEMLVQRSDTTLSVALGAAAPDFELTSLDGDTVRLSEQLGHPVLLVYFATW